MTRPGGKEHKIFGDNTRRPLKTILDNTSDPRKSKRTNTTQRIEAPCSCYKTWEFSPSLSSEGTESEGKNLGSIPGLGRSPGEGNGNPLQYSCLENSMDRRAWWATVHGIIQN